MTAAPRSLQNRILALVLGFVAAVWIATCALAWIDARHELDELLDGHLAQAAALLVVQQGGEMDEHRELRTPTLHRYAPKVAFQIFHGGRVVLASQNAPHDAMLDPRTFREGFRTVAIDGADWRVFAARAAERDVQVYVSEQVASRDSILLAVLHGAFWPMLAALPVLALALWWAVRRGVSPMRRLGEALERRTPLETDAVSVSDAPREMQPMLDALNGLFARIRALLESERRFTADAAHELRTPIAAIRAQAQVALGEAEVHARQRALESTIEGCDRLVRLVEQLLTLSRMEAAVAGSVGPADVAAVARRVAADLAPRAIAKDQRLELHAENDCWIAGDETLLAVLVRNVLDNALRYSPRGARVVLSVAAEEGRIVLRVEDSGPGLGDVERGRLGERFFRAAGTSESGSGLGWSIVRRVAADTGMEVRAERSIAFGGLAVVASAPRARR